jgi:hypothetical protein
MRSTVQAAEETRQREDNGYMATGRNRGWRDAYIELVASFASFPNIL